MTALVPCIAISTGFVLLTCFICEALRKIIEAVVPEGLLKTALKEFVAGAELCGCGFELIISKLFSRTAEILYIPKSDIHCRRQPSLSAILLF